MLVAKPAHCVPSQPSNLLVDVLKNRAPFVPELQAPGVPLNCGRSNNPLRVVLANVDWPATPKVVTPETAPALVMPPLLTFKPPAAKVAAPVVLFSVRV